MDFPHSTVIHETDEHGTFEEFMFKQDDASILLLAPHGGQVEPNTDTESLLIADFVENAVVWGTRGITNGGYDSAYNRWHTTSRTHPLHMFPLYQNARDEFDYDVSLSLHVMSDDGILIGGQASEKCRDSLRNHLSKIFPDENVRIAYKGDKNAGMKDGNFVNSSSTENPIHIEQSVDIASNHPTRFSRAIGDWLNNTDFSAF